MKSAIRQMLLAVGAVTLSICDSESAAETISFDFDSGVGSAFSVFNVGRLFTIDTDGPDLRISKPADDGTVLPDGFLLGGIESGFTIDGDFTVTIDFALHDFPATPGPSQLNESVLAVETETGEIFEILRFRLGSLDLIESFAVPGGVIDSEPSTLQNGRYRITRSGTSLTAWFSEPDGAFTSLGSVDAFPGPYRIQPFAAQGSSKAGTRSLTALDVSFDNLVIEADQIDFPCPDLDGDGEVGIGDFLLVLAQWGPCPPECLGDVDGDGEVGILDFLFVLANWGPCP